MQSNEARRADAQIYEPKRKFTILQHFLNSYQWVKQSFLHIYFILLHCCIRRLPCRVNVAAVNLDGSPMVLLAFMIVSSWDWLSSFSLCSALLVCGAECCLGWIHRTINLVVHLKTLNFKLILKDLHLRGLADHISLHLSIIYLWLSVMNRKWTYLTVFQNVFAGNYKSPYN